MINLWQIAFLVNKLIHEDIQEHKKFHKKNDFFCTTQFLRYKSQPQYTSLFDGIISLIIIVGLIVMFYNKFIDCINQVSISSSSIKIISPEPTPYTISTNEGDNFMLGFEVWAHDLNAQERYFDIVMTSVQFNTGDRNYASVEYQLEACTKAHWERFPDALKQFDRLQMNRWLCLPFNTIYPLSGKCTSAVSKTLQFAVKKCTSTSNPSRPCAPQSQIDNFFQQEQHLILTTYFINPLINPSNQNYLTYYLQDKYYVYFTKHLGTEGILYMEDLEINTDQSILPFVMEKTEVGGMVSQQVLQNIYEVPDDYDVYCSTIIFKSGVTRIYQRGFQKLDQLLSYIGGLFGTISVCLFREKSTRLKKVYQQKLISMAKMNISVLKYNSSHKSFNPQIKFKLWTDPMFFLIINRFILQFKKNNPTFVSPKEISESSSSDSSQSSSDDESKKQVINQLARLKQEASSGNAFSKKIWDITNKSILHVLPNLLLTQQNLIFSTLNLTSQGHQQVHQAGQISNPIQLLLPNELHRQSPQKTIHSTVIKSKIRPFKPRLKTRQESPEKLSSIMNFKSINKSLNQTEVNSSDH